jgi:DNA-binding CsgD family transcriptional regulator
VAERRPEPIPRQPEATAISALLAQLTTEPAGLVITGEAGMGKTTLWLAGCRDAVASGVRVLSARGDPAEVRLTFAALADLLGDVEQDVIDQLPTVQQSALNRILMRGNDGPAINEHAAAAAFRAVVDHLSSITPVLIAIDDVQWIDTSSAAAVRFAARRLSGAVGLLVTARTGEPDTTDAVSWLQLHHPDAVTRTRMSPLTLGGLHTLISRRLGRVLPRPTMVRIHEISGGNPLYALELAHAIVDGRGIDHELPDTLAALVRARLRGIDADTTELLLAAACMPEATVEAVAAATRASAARVVELLESGDAARIVVITGNRIRFAHPLLATGVYTSALSNRRREMHRRLADCVEMPELKARHLASAAVSGDTATLEALDHAADATASQGAPAAAAELVELAITLGGDTPLRRIRAAEHHFRAGSVGPARELLQPAVDELPPGPTRCLALMLLGAILGYADDVEAAVQAFTQAVDEAEDGTELRLHCLLRVVLVTFMTGRVDLAEEHAKSAVALAENLGVPGLRSRALSIWVLVNFMQGRGVDDAALQLALELEDPNGDATTWYLASAMHAMISAWTGNLTEARDQMRAVHQRMLNGGTEIDIIWAANHLATIDVWLGRYGDAGRACRDAVQRAEQMGGRQVLVTAWGHQAEVAAYGGREAEARTAADASITTAIEGGARYLVDAPTATLAFLEVSLGNYGAAMNVLEPLLAAFDARHTEINTGQYLPDAIEALTGLGRVDDADLLVKALQDNGTRLDRDWMLAIAARGQALCLAARGDLVGAEEAAAAAMMHHDRLPMPFERARTQLLLGQLQRRRRQKAAATATLQEALDAFDDLGAPLWSERARAELARLSTTDRPRHGLTPAELRIAERAAAGLSNKEIAAEQFLAIKTVEMTLSSAYRKLGIRSRAQLHGRLDTDDCRENPGSTTLRRQ